MTKGFYYSKRAKSDLRRIFRDSVLLFGPMQARRYSHAIDRACQDLAEDRSRNRPLVARGVPYTTRQVGVHVLICSVDSGGALRIVRILHSRMDLQRHL